MLTKGGAIIVLRYYFRKEGPPNPSNKDNSTVKLKLYTNDRVPQEDDTPLDYREAEGSGYEAQTIPLDTWQVLLENGIPTAKPATQRFRFTQALVPAKNLPARPIATASIYGWYLEDMLGNLIEAKRVPYVFTPSENPSALELTPKIQLGTPEYVEPTLTLAEVAAINGVTVTLNVTASDDVAMRDILIGEQLNDMRVYAYPGVYNYTFSSTGQKVLFVQARDAALNLSYPATLNITIPPP